MARPPVDLTGMKFGRLTAKTVVGTSKQGTKWECECDCGNATVVASSHLKKGSTRSCGCLRKELNEQVKHGETKTRLYSVWSSMKQRCTNEKNQAYKNYGGRGISVCDSWSCDYESFREWALNNGYKDGLTIERLDFNGDYFPENCIFIPSFEQNANTRRNIFVEFEGEKMTLTRVASKVGINYRTLLSRYRSGIREPQLFEPLKRVRTMGGKA